MNSRGALVDRTLAEDTLHRVREGLAHSETACVTQVLEVLQEMAQKADRLSIQDLADLIGRDLTTVTKVMKAAHCLGYNPAGVEVTTLSEAIAVIGFDKIRNLVLSLLLIETAEGRGAVTEARDVAAVALTSALTAQALCSQSGSLNADQAFVCAALRQYGRLLLCTFLPDEYELALQQTQADAPEVSFRSVFGLTTFELAQRILADANLPKLIANTIQPVSPHLLQSASLSEGERLLVISDFAAKVCAVLARADWSAEQCEAGLDALVRSNVRVLGLTEKELSETLRTVNQTLHTFARAHGVERFSSLLISRLQSLADGKTWAGQAPGSRRLPTLAGDQESKPGDPLQAALGEVERLLAARPRNAKEIFTVAVRGIRRALRLRSCLLFLPESNGRLFAATIGSGTLFEEVRDRSLLDPHQRDVFTVCLERGEDAVIQEPSDPKIAPFIPDWFKEATGAGPLVLLPVRDRAGTFAVFCGVVTAGERVILTATRLQQLKALRNQLAVLRH